MRKLSVAAIVLAAMIVATAISFARTHSMTWAYHVRCGARHSCIEKVARVECLILHDANHCAIYDRWREHKAHAARVHILESTGGPWSIAIASEYGTTDGFLWGTTADGSQVTPTSLGVANLSLAFGTQVEFCVTGCVIATVDDRGPYVAGRLFDLQPAVAQAIGFDGLGPVRWRIVS